MQILQSRHDVAAAIRSQRPAPALLEQANRCKATHRYGGQTHVQPLSGQVSSVWHKLGFLHVSLEIVSLTMSILVDEGCWQQPLKTEAFHAMQIDSPMLRRRTHALNCVPGSLFVHMQKGYLKTGSSHKTIISGLHDSSQ